MISPSEPLHVINNRLRDRFGLIENGMTRWRVSWSTDQFEKRWVSELSGIVLAYPEVREMPKYPMNQDFFVLERVIPTFGNTELIEAFSYEPIWFFKDKDDNPLPPKWTAIEFIIHQINEQVMNAGHGPKYKQANETEEERELKVKKIYEALYGNETSIGDRLSLGEGVGYTGKVN